ncbi:hypothetical protein BLNAU_1324 [Blattamonas nauphoetae]|uniref:Uncharacterized protein n=1 Tax=Blattamonas nauphoetae TaxID=2049346 RepID=A0ABQ9YJ15_9EUKA|nr:hypothetical protein BLNAU_1324 [Blattamonas nauphoetae]
MASWTSHPSASLSHTGIVQVVVACPSDHLGLLRRTSVADRGKNQLNKRLLQLEADAFHMTKLGVISFKKSGSVEDLARSVELMTLKAAEVTRSVNDIRIAHFLALPVLDDADATKRESQERQEKRLEELMEKKEKMTVQRRKLQSVDPLFFRQGPGQGRSRFRAGGYQTFQGWGAQNQTNFRPAHPNGQGRGRGQPRQRSGTPQFSNRPPNQKSTQGKY